MPKQQLLTGARRQKVTIRRRVVAGGPEWQVTFHSGRTDTFDTAAYALAAVKADAANGNATATVTVIDWLGVPNGWKPPESDACLACSHSRSYHMPEHSACSHGDCTCMIFCES